MRWSLVQPVGCQRGDRPMSKKLSAAAAAVAAGKVPSLDRRVQAATQQHAGRLAVAYPSLRPFRLRLVLRYFHRTCGVSYNKTRTPRIRIYGTSPFICRITKKASASSELWM